MTTPGGGETTTGDADAFTDAERAAIARQVALELRIRDEVEEQAKKKEGKSKGRIQGWLESNVVLLLLGSAITGFLVPYWQNQQETIKWQRQNQHDNYSYRLTQMRQCLQDFLDLAAYTSDANELAKPVLANAKLARSQFDTFAGQLREIQQKRFHQTSKVFALLIHFPRPDALSVSYERYTALAAPFMTEIDALAVETLALTRTNASSTTWRTLENRSDQLAARFAGINAAFDAVVVEMRTQIKEVEHESEQLK